MVSFFKLLSKVDNRSRYAVHGWIRNVEHKLQINYIPNKLSSIPCMVSSICILYFRDDETFDTTSHSVILSSDHKSITKRANHFDWSNNCYGIIEVDSQSQLICQWDLKINRSIYNHGIRVGLLATESLNKQIPVSDNYYIYWSHPSSGKKTHHHAYYIADDVYNRWTGYNGRWFGYGNRFVEDNEVSICLDLKKSEIRFLVNFIDQGIAFTKIRKGPDIRYRLTVSIFYPTDVVEIKNFYKQ